MNQHIRSSNRTMTGVSNSAIAPSGAERPARRTETARAAWVAARRTAGKPSIRKDLAEKRAAVNACVAVPDHLRKPPEATR